MPELKFRPTYRLCPRAENRRAHPHDGGALFHRDVEVVAHPHRQLAKLAGRDTALTRPSRISAQPFEPRPGDPRDPPHTVAAPSAPPPVPTANGRPPRTEPAGRPRRHRTWWPRRPSPLESTVSATYVRRPPPVEQRQQLETVDRVDIGERPERPFVPCSSADDRQDATYCEVRPFRGFSVGLPARGSPRNPPGRRQTPRGRPRRGTSWRWRRDGYRRDCGPPCGPPARGGRARRRDWRRLTSRHFLIDDRMPFTCSAYSPVGAAFR